MKSPIATRSRRPVGVTVIALLLWLMAISGFFTVYVAYGTAWQWAPLDTFRYLYGIGDRSLDVLAAAAAAYGVASVATGVGLWRGTEWAFNSFSIWVVAALLFGAIFVALFNLSIMWGAFVVLVLPGLLLTSVWRYLRRACAKNALGAL